MLSLAASAIAAPAPLDPSVSWDAASAAFGRPQIHWDHDIGGEPARAPVQPFAGLGADADVAWPFTGEYWRDELPTYRQRLESNCGR